MNAFLRSLTHEPLSWKEVTPPAFKSWLLPGSKLFSSSGEFGTIVIQEYKTDQYTIRLNVFELLQRFIAKTVFKGSGLYSTLVIKGRADLDWNDNFHYSLRQNQFNLLYDHDPVIISRYSERMHITMETFFSNELNDTVANEFPGIKKERGVIVDARHADAEVLNVVHSLMRCTLDKGLRRQYFENRVRDLLFKYLVIADSKTMDPEAPSDAELAAIYRAEEVISQDISLHRAIPELSRMVLLNEFRFKKLFKRVFGVGPYEYLVQKRLNRAKELLESGLSVKEVAEEVGYRPSDFTTAFRQYFGFTPSSVKRRGS